MSVTCLIKTIEEMVLGLGKHTGQWFESAPAPENDGEVLIVQIDSKATPAATEEELGKRGCKRAVNVMQIRVLSATGVKRHVSAGVVVTINILEIYFFSTIKLLRVAPSE